MRCCMFDFWYRKQVKMTHKHIQTKANTDKLCETMQNQCYSLIKKKQRNLGVRFEPFPLLEFSPPLEICSDIYTGPTSCLIVTLLLMFCSSDIFLSVYSQSANIRPVHSNWALSSCYHYKTRPLLLIGCMCVLGHGQTLLSKVLFKNCLVHLNMIFDELTWGFMKWQDYCRENVHG